jgi:hypothetical protein
VQLAHGVLVVVEDDDVHGGQATILPALQAGPRALASRACDIPPQRGDPDEHLDAFRQRAGVRAQLGNLLNWLDKAAGPCRREEVRHRQLPGPAPGARHAAVRVKQIQIASDAAKGCVARLAGTEIPKWDDTEATLDDLRARIRKTLDLRAVVPAAQVDGSEGRDITITLRSRRPVQITGALPAALGAAELLLPHHDHLCAAAPRRRGPGQGRLPQGLMAASGAGGSPSTWRCIMRSSSASKSRV